ncbi:MAG: glycosyltransferase [Bacteroidota bacterium]
MLAVLMFLGGLLLLLYAALMQWYHQTRQLLPTFHLAEDYEPQVPLIILIPARNEETSIEACLRSLQTQHYPSHLWRCIVIDDHSTDQTGHRVLDLQDTRIQLLKLADEGAMELAGGKKQALQLGIDRSTEPFVLTTDADCILPTNWLRSMAYHFECKRAWFVSGNVVFTPDQNGFERFQALDLLGMMGLTMAGIASGMMHLGNGANLGFAREAFLAAGGYTGNADRASGDDVFLAQKIGALAPDRMFYLANPTLAVQTPPVPSWSAFVQQRVRWGNKTGQYSDKRLIAVAALVFFLCLWILLAIPASLWLGSPLFLGALGVWLGKALVDYHYLSSLANAFDRPDLLHSFWLSEWYHTIYIAWVGILANVQQNYRWKGRKLR